MDAYERGVAALLDYLNLDPVMAAGHKEYATPVGRKVDPSFDMVDFRNNLEKIMSTGGPRREVTPVSPSRSMLRKGMSGPSVKVLQKKLGVKEDGHFGPGTELAVRVFQKKAGLTVDGLAGPTTWKAIGL
jgi:peptidoglycan hydrolase-like protein with peptidoglycan-binding domain